jgi:protein-tyrosine phosphatase
MKEIFWIKGNPPAPLAIVLRPRGGDWLEDDLLRLKQGGIETVVSMLEEDEAVLLALAEESVLAKKIGMQFLSFPIPDTQVPPDNAALRSFVAGLATRLRAGERVGVHCRGSVGRATVIAACTLIQLGWQPKAALATIASARGLAVPDTQEQAEWILNYQAEP